MTGWGGCVSSDCDEEWGLSEARTNVVNVPIPVKGESMVTKINQAKSGLVRAGQDKETSERMLINDISLSFLTTHQ